MARSLLLFENLETTRRHRLFRIGGTAVSATPYAWLSPFFWGALGVAIALVRPGESETATRLMSGVGLGIALVLTNTLHSLGHMAAGQLVGTPPVSILLTATRDVCSFGTIEPAPSKAIRLGRACGGPAANLCVGVLCLAAGRTSGVPWLTTLGIVNASIGLWTLCPVPSLDGWVIWGLISGRRR